MQTTTKKVIVDKLKEDLEKKFNVANSYSKVEEVKSGIFLWDDFLLKPAISFWAYKDMVEEYLMGRNRIMLLHFYLYCYLENDGVGGVGDIYEFSENVEKFLQSSNFTYSDDVIIGDSVIYTGGSQDRASICQIEFQVRYNKT